jgi:hypothetical protein
VSESSASSLLVHTKTALGIASASAERARVCVEKRRSAPPHRHSLNSQTAAAPSQFNFHPNMLIRLEDKNSLSDCDPLNLKKEAPHAQAPVWKLLANADHAA